jgi:adenylate cyclase
VKLSLNKATMTAAVAGLLVVVVLTLKAFGLIGLPLIDAANRQLYDLQLNLTLPNSKPTGVVILDIDERSLGAPALGRWPWSRDKISALMQKLFDDYGVKVVAFDVIFAEPDTSSGLAVLRKLAQSELAGNTAFRAKLEELEPVLDYDGLFEETLMSYPIVLGYYFNFGKNPQKAGALPPESIVIEKSASSQFPVAGGFGGNLAGFEEVAAASGHFSPMVDVDGVVRKIPLYVTHGGVLYQSLSLATARMALAVDTSKEGALRLPPVNFSGGGGRVDPTSGQTSEAVQIGDRRIPLQRDGTVLVPYTGGRESFRYLPAIDILEGKVSPDLLKGAVVIVGTTAPGLLDLRATPVGGIYPGVEVHANAIASFLNAPGSAPLRHTPHYAEVVIAAGVLMLGLLTLVGSVWASPLVSGAVTLFLLVMVGGASQIAWRGGEFWPIAEILIACVSVYAIVTIINFANEYRNKKQFTSLFGQYVPPELVEMMAEDPERYSMAGVKKNLTVLFSDVRGFTSISEKLSPADLAEFINRYLSEMSRIIRDGGGTLDKYIGDAIMAFWGAPIDEPQHAQKAVLTALSMINRLHNLSEEYAAKGWPAISIGVGLSTGPMSVGDMGSDVRRAYTVMGDAVNLGSRLEGLTRIYGTWILLPEATVNDCEGIAFREIDRVKVKGKDEPITIYEPLGLEAELSNDVREEVSGWQAALSAYRLAEFSSANTLLADLRQRWGNKPMYDWLESVCNSHIHNPPANDWVAVTKFDTK